MEEAINQLQDLGVTRGQAKRALARYNNDVALAADYIFSGADLSDEEQEQETLQHTMESDEQLALRLSQETPSMQQVPLTKDTAYDPSSWSVVPFTPVEEKKADISLTWWKDPENPSDRLAIDHIPTGLRPPSYHFAYAPIVLQALFHVTAFQHAVLSFRPLPSTWGSPHNYWRGFGEPVPNDMIQTTTTTPVVVKEGDLIPLDSPEATPLAQLSLEDTPIMKPTHQPMSKSMQAFAELQKLFGYMHHTKRAYANVSHFVRALNMKEQPMSDWEYNDVSFDVFLDMLIQCLVQVDEQSTQATHTDFVPVFRNLFLLKARIEYKDQNDDYDDDEVYYLTIRLDHGMDSFYACLDPLIYVENDRFTTFRQIPPLIWVVLENRISPHTTDLPYTIDTTIYMDRYMQENRKKALEGFEQIQSFRQQLLALEAQIQALEGNSSLSRLDILTHTMTYFKDQQDMIDILSTVQQSIQARLASLKNKRKEIKQDMANVFRQQGMQQKPYGLRATLHHDGKHGTGHYWAYVYVEPSEISLLPDMPVEDKGGWFKFCDASVVSVSDQAMLDDPTPPFSLLYASHAIPQFTRDQLNQCIPQTLFDFIQSDHALLEQEIEEELKPSTTSSMYFDDTGSVGTAVPMESQVFTGESLNQLKTTVDQRMVQVAELSGHDPVFLKSFEAFLARSQNQSALEHLYLLYSSEKDSLDEEASLSDPELEIIWQEYNRYLNVAQWIVQALDSFVQQDYSHALHALLTTKQQEALWKTQLMLNQDVYQAYHGLEALSFQPLIERYGKACLQIMNDTAYAKASQPSYRTRGLEDGIRLAHQAQAIIGSDPMAKEALSERWLSFTEGSELTDHQAELLNTLIMTWLEGQDTNNNEQQAQEFTYSSLEPLWKTYQHLCTESELLLLQTNTE